MNALVKVHIPKTIAALFIIVVFFGGVTAVGFSLSGPGEWIAKAPQSIARLEQPYGLRAHCEHAEGESEVENCRRHPNRRQQRHQRVYLGSTLLSGARTMVAEFATMALFVLSALSGVVLAARRDPADAQRQKQAWTFPTRSPEYLGPSCHHYADERRRRYHGIATHMFASPIRSCGAFSPSSWSTIWVRSAA
jgi:hypothetical protein